MQQMGGIGPVGATTSQAAASSVRRCSLATHAGHDQPAWVTVEPEFHIRVRLATPTRKGWVLIGLTTDHEQPPNRRGARPAPAPSASLTRALLRIGVAT